MDSSTPIPPSSSSPTEELHVPDNFRGIIQDFTKDLSITFPEYAFLWEKWTVDEVPEEVIHDLFRYSLSVFPERFFDILYQNEEIFQPASEVNTMFLPNVEFKLLFTCANVSEQTQKTMWKYLQLILFTILSSVKHKSNFGDSMNIFDGVDENELQDKLHETIENITDFFANMDLNTEGAEGTEEEKPSNENGETADASSSSPFHFDNIKDFIPNPEEMHDHLRSLFDGKIGTLAKELAEEITHDITGLLGDDMDLQNVKSTQDVLKNLMKNPKKMLDLVKTVSKKLNTKMENGEISQEEIMKEASDILGKMKEMGGHQQFNAMFKNLAKQMGGGMNGSKLDMNAMAAQMKLSATKEKMKEKLKRKTTASASTSGTLQQKDANTFVFKLNDESVPPPHHSSLHQKEEIDKIMSDFGLEDTAPAAVAPKKKSHKKKK